MNGFREILFPKISIWIMVMILAILGFTSSAHAVKPQTIPAIQQWTDGTGNYNFIASSRIVLNQAHSSQLAVTAQVFQDDLLALTGVSHPIVVGTQGNTVAGDIFITLGDADSAIGTEGYNMIINDRVVISAATDAGAFYGTRTILQMLKQGTAIGAGVAKDFPRYKLRGLHVDSGRKFVTVGWLKNHIKELAYFKMNLFHWHMSEWNNFRFESSSHPEIMAASRYSKAEVQDMMNLAAKYHVIIMPEFEMPGHMNWALAKHPELRAVDSAGNQSVDNLDLTNPAAYTFVTELLNEWLPLIPGPYFHIGTDEYITDFSKYPQFTTYAKARFGANANAKDVYLNFINEMNRLVRSYGKTTWAWDDSKTGGSVISLDKNILLDSWTFAAQSELNQGFTLVNSAQASLYYVWYTDWQPMQTQLYEQWAPNQWTYNNPGPIPPFAPGLLGAKLELWFDKNQCEEYSMAWGMRNSMRSVAQHNWASPKLVTAYSGFQALSDRLGRAPGTTFPSNLPPISNPNGPYSSTFGSPITFSSAGTAARNGTIAGYKWDFGDGGTSTQANPTYTYRNSGNFKALLVVTDSNGMTAGNEAQVSVGTTPPPGSVSVSPASVTLAPSGTQQFTATVSGTSNQSVTWTATGGTITSGGFYTAPLVAGGYSVKATSVAFPNISGTGSVTVTANPPDGSNLALNKPTTASSQFSSTYAASKATDGDKFNTRWCAVNGTNGQWLLVDLNGTFNLTGTQVKWESNGVWKYKVEVSQNKTQWTLVVDRTANTVPAQTYDDSFIATARYVRITATTNQPGHWASIYDFEVFGRALKNRT